jgi:cholesterol oxidase
VQVQQPIDDLSAATGGVRGVCLRSHLWDECRLNAPDFDAIVIGSGFGGSVVTDRLAEAGLRVCLLERGRAYPPGSFPRTPLDLSRGFWDPSEGHYGLFNVWSFDNLGSLVSSGLGGGSLIYANILIRKDPETFVRDEHETWPITYDDLEEHYERAEQRLNAQRYPFEHEPYGRAPKVFAMKQAAEGLDARLGISGVTWEAPPQAITFSNPGEAPRVGVEIKDAPPSVHEHPHPRLTCVLSGECNLGCNYGSKNTVDLMFLGTAKRNGAVIRTSCEVKGVAEAAGGGYAVTVVDHTQLAEEGVPRRDLPEETLRAPRVVFSAGTLGSTFLLLKSQAGLPKINRELLGTRFSSNGDLLTFLVRAGSREQQPRVLEASYGPVITSAIRVPPDPGQRRGHYIEDAGYPYLLSWFVQLATLPGVTRTLLRRRWLARLEKLIGRGADSDLGAEFSELFKDVALSSSSMPLLGMGRDLPNGRLLLDSEGRLTTTWTPDGSKNYFDEIERTARAIADELKGDFKDSRIRGLSKLITVHALGGCPMGRDAREGFVNEYGEVFGYEGEGLYVADGSVMPGPIGPNPSLTIAAVADRIAGRIVG